MSYIKDYNFELLDSVIDINKTEETFSVNSIINNNPVIIEIGCGNGHFLIRQAMNNPLNNYIGIDIKDRRLIRCREKEIKYELKNIHWILGEASESIAKLFNNESISEFYMPFPDPWPKRRHHKNRLFKKEFIDIFYNKLKPGGYFIFITDHFEYFKSSLKLIQADSRFQIIPKEEVDQEDLTNSIFGERWKKDNRDFHLFCIKKI